MGRFSERLGRRLRGRDDAPSKAPPCASKTSPWDRVARDGGAAGERRTDGGDGGRRASHRPDGEGRLVRLDAMSEADFLRRRRMFRVDPEAPEVARLAPEGRGGNHREWMSDLDDFVYRRTVRGYHLDGEIVFYKGYFEPVSLRHVLEALPALVEALSLDPGTTVWIGANERARGALAGANPAGTVEDLTRRWELRAPATGAGGAA